jgi:solute carrier family 26 (sodium-independent sulfate anion transporter), member 11
MKLVEDFKSGVANDVTVRRTRELTVKGARALPSASVVYLKDKVPIVGWLPRYNYRWLLNDAVAGITIGLMLIPQSLAYAKIATIPVQYGLMASWLPATLYAFMGTTKGTSPRHDPPSFPLILLYRSFHRTNIAHRAADIRSRG